MPSFNVRWQAVWKGEPVLDTGLKQYSCRDGAFNALSSPVFNMFNTAVARLRGQEDVSVREAASASSNWTSALQYAFFSRTQDFRVFGEFYTPDPSTGLKAVTINTPHLVERLQNKFPSITMRSDVYNNGFTGSKLPGMVAEGNVGLGYVMYWFILGQRMLYSDQKHLATAKDNTFKDMNKLIERAEKETGSIGRGYNYGMIWKNMLENQKNNVFMDIVMTFIAARGPSEFLGWSDHHTRSQVEQNAEAIELLLPHIDLMKKDAAPRMY